LAVAWIGADVFYVFLYIFAFCEREKKKPFQRHDPELRRQGPRWATRGFSIKGVQGWTAKGPARGINYLYRIIQKYY
jgi:hypothetical protein